MGEWMNGQMEGMKKGKEEGEGRKTNSDAAKQTLMIIQKDCLNGIDLCSDNKILQVTQVLDQSHYPEDILLFSFHIRIDQSEARQGSCEN